MYVEELGQYVEPWVMGKSPAVLSLGARCMKKRYSFVWPNQRTPYLIDHENYKVIRLKVQGDIPYLVPTDPFCQPIDPGGDHPDLTAEQRFGATLDFQLAEGAPVQAGSSDDPAPPPAVSYTHLTLPTKRIV